MKWEVPLLFRGTYLAFQLSACLELIPPYNYPRVFKKNFLLFFITPKIKHLVKEMLGSKSPPITRKSLDESKAFNQDSKDDVNLVIVCLFPQFHGLPFFICESSGTKFRFSTNYHECDCQKTKRFNKCGFCTSTNENSYSARILLLFAHRPAYICTSRYRHAISLIVAIYPPLRFHF